MTNYLNTYYSEDKRPLSNYPELLAAHLVKKLNLDSTSTLLDVGCGRGDLLKSFKKIGMNVQGTDLDPESLNLCSPLPVFLNDIEKEPLPFDDNSIEIIFSKSVIEHLHKPEFLVTEAYRVLKPGGRIIIMCPSWVHMGWGPFYQDHTHVTPFTKPSLRDIIRLAGFSHVQVFHFTQLPAVWRAPFLKVFCEIVRKLPIPYSPQNDIKYPNSINKFIRFSNEIMLLSSGVKI